MTPGLPGCSFANHIFKSISPLERFIPDRVTFKLLSELAKSLISFSFRNNPVKNDSLNSFAAITCSWSYFSFTLPAVNVSPV